MTLTAAKFKMLREAMGLSSKWLADYFGVQERAVKRWEAGDQDLPVSRAVETLELWARFHDQANVYKTARDRITVPRVGEDSPDQMPERWHRAAAAYTGLLDTDTTIDYYPDSTKEAPPEGGA